MRLGLCGLAIAVWCSCVEDSGPCPDGLMHLAPACVPRFSQCKHDELALPGGGCRRIAVEAVAGGLKLWPDGGFVPLGPTCAKGFRGLAGGGCEPILPPVDPICPAGSMQVIGHATCQPIGSCGSGDYGDVAATSGAVHVNAGYTGSDSDGSSARPFATIKAALVAASKTGSQLLAIAGGTYNEDVVLDRTVTLRGRCAKLVTIKGQSATGAAVTVQTGAGGSKIEGVTITGPNYGILLAASADVEISAVAVLDTGHSGIRAESSEHGVAGGAVKHSLLANCNWAGISLRGARFDVDACEIRGSKQLVDYGRGIAVEFGAGRGSELTLRDSVIQGGEAYGIGCYTSKVLMERSVIRDNGFRGLDSFKSTLDLKHSVFDGNRSAALWLSEVDLTLDSCTLRGTGEFVDSALGHLGAFGLWAVKGSKLQLQSSVLAENGVCGLVLVSSEATIKRSIVRDTRERATDDRLGTGLQIGSDTGDTASTVKIEESLVTGNREFGLQIFHSTVDLDRTVVSDTMPPRPYGRFDMMAAGIGAFASDASAPCSVTLKDALIAGNHARGIMVAGADAKIDGTVVRDTGAVLYTDSMPCGLHAGAYFKDDKAGPTSRVAVRDALLADNRLFGLIVSPGAEVTVERSTVRDGVPRAGVRPDVPFTMVSNAYVQGRPLWVNRGFPAVLRLADSLLEVNGTADNMEIVTGLILDRSAEVDVERSTIRANPAAHNTQSVGGIISTFWGDTNGPQPKLTVKHSEILGARGAGAYLADASVSIERSAFTAARDPYGDCVYVGNYKHKARIEMTDCVVQGCQRAGVLLDRAGGTIRGSVFRTNAFPIYLYNGAAPDISDDNVYQDNRRDSVGFGSELVPAPVPELPDVPLPAPP